MKQKNQSITVSTRQVQESFRERIFNHQNTDVLNHIRPGEISPEIRFNIYRNTIIQNLCHALELTFPAIWELVGKECADSLARAFAGDPGNSPQTNCLDDWGDRFPEFLFNCKPVKHLFYLKDIAEIEWLKHLSFRALDDEVLAPDKLLSFLNNHPERLHLLFNATVSMYSSPYYLKDIFDLIENPSAVNNIELQLIPSYVVITRQNSMVVTVWISKDRYIFIDALIKGMSLAESYEQALKTNPEFDLPAALQFITTYDLLRDCTY